MTMKKAFALAVAAVAVSLTFTQAAQAGPRLDKIMESKVIRVGTPGDYRPFAIKTDIGFSGHDIDLIETMAKELGVKVEYVQTSWPNLMKDLQSNQFDVAVGGITRNVNRIRLVEMLPGYAPFGKVALVRSADKAKFTTADSLKQPGVRVIKNPGGTNEAYVLANLKAAQVATHDHEKSTRPGHRRRSHQPVLHPGRAGRPAPRQDHGVQGVPCRHTRRLPPVCHQDRHRLFGP